MTPCGRPSLKRPSGLSRDVRPQDVEGLELGGAEHKSSKLNPNFSPFCATVARCHGGTLPRWHGATVPRWHGGTVPQSHSALVRKKLVALESVDQLRMSAIFASFRRFDDDKQFGFRQRPDFDQRFGGTP
jgi:hypothetical protein